MRAFTLDSFETAPGYRDDLPVPSAGADELLVRVRASSVNPADAAIASGMLKGMAEYDFPVTLGRDFAGVVEDSGPDVGEYGPGDAVYGFVLHANPTVHDGSWADYTVIPEGSVSRKPESVAIATAGAAPVAGLVAVAAFDALELAPGDVVFVIGAAGGVGSFFVQLAASAGAHVITPALPRMPSTSMTSASARSSSGTPMSRPRSANASPKASTPFSTSSPSRRMRPC